MKQPSFLARKTLGQPNYFLLAMAVVFLVAFMPRGARRALEGNTNKAEDWLPPNYSESTELEWFRDYFFGEQFALVSWDGCTLGETEKLNRLARMLVPSKEILAKADKDSDLVQRSLWYKHVLTGPQVLEELTTPPLSLDYADAVKRIEGALVGPVQHDAQGNSLGNESRTTCLIVFLTEEATATNRIMRQAIEHITEIASTECAIAKDTIHMGGPPVDNITIDIEGERTLQRLALLSGFMGLGLSYWCFRSFKLTGVVFTVGVLSAGMSLAIVFYFGIVEVMFTALTSPRLGTVDAILMSMPAVVYVLGLSGAIHIVNYYRDARGDSGLHGAAETAVKLGWGPCTLAAFTTAVGLGSLYTSDILPIKKFGMFTAIAVMGTVGILFTVLPVFLHRFPVSEELIRRQAGGRDKEHLPRWAKRLFGFIVQRHALALVMWLVVMGVFSVGFTKIGTSVQLLKLLDEDTDLIHDYAWLEENLGNLVPMEVVITVPQERCRTAEEHAEADGMQYRMTMLERLTMVREMSAQFAAMPEVSRVMSAATYTPESTHSGLSVADRSTDYTKNKSLEDRRDALLESGYLRMERVPEGHDETPARELWRLSARVAALAEDEQGEGVDYGTFVNQLRNAVEPILMTYQQRDRIVAGLHLQGKQLDGAQLCILYRTADNDPAPTSNTQEARLRDLLLRSGVRGKDLPAGGKSNPVSFYNLADFDAHEDDPEYLDRAITALGEQDALVLVSAGSDPTAKMLAAGGLYVIDVTDVTTSEGSAAIPAVSVAEAPRPMRAVYTGMIPLVYKTQRELLYSLKESIIWATVLISVVMMFVLRSPIAGAISMIPNVFPIVIIFGGLGWLGIKIDIGIMMTASVALGVAVDDTVHFLPWFRRGVRQGMDRLQAVMLAYDRCATAMTQTTIIGGLGLAVFATSTFTPTQQFGYLMISMLSAALVGDLLLLPAILVGPLGKYFARQPISAASVPTMERVEEALQGPTPAALPVAAVEPQRAPAEMPPAPVEAETIPALPSEELREELVEGPHAALHAKLRSLRREEYPHDSVSS
ncbi:MAG: MMPL family transporter [Pirellulales bacterium]|nr:MMPL family transporter [Pirellulales bacterium]